MSCEILYSEKILVIFRCNYRYELVNMMHNDAYLPEVQMRDLNQDHNKASSCEETNFGEGHFGQILISRCVLALAFNHLKDAPIARHIICLSVLRDLRGPTTCARRSSQIQMMIMMYGSDSQRGGTKIGTKRCKRMLYHHICIYTHIHNHTYIFCAHRCASCIVTQVENK